MSDIVIIIPFDPVRTSPNRNRRLCWQARMREVRRAREAALLAWRQAGCPTADGRVRVQITIRRGRRMDPDNALACAKPLVDQLFSARCGGCGIVADDSERWVSYEPVVQETGKRYALRPEVVVTIIPSE